MVTLGTLEAWRGQASAPCCSHCPSWRADEPFAQPAAYDVLIRGGRIIDGSGNPSAVGDLAIQGDRIVALGELGAATAGRVIDASGLVVAPGFIDMHAHSDLTLLADGAAESKVRQGVTVEVLGEGGSVAPRDGLTEEAGEGPAPDWTTFTEYFDRTTQQGISVNVASYVARRPGATRRCRL